jgi:hypothetical protein
MGVKPSDRWTISLCHFHHVEQHHLGERAFEAKHDLNMIELASEFAKKSPFRWRVT